MNKYCFRNCAYNDVCNLNEENTALCKIADNKDSQDFRRSTIFGIKTEHLLEMQHKNKLKSKNERIKGNMKDSCKKKDCRYWRDTPSGDSHAKCMTCCHSAWLPKSENDNYDPLIMQLIHGDCLEKMKDIPDGSVDMILCDLPYGTTACKWDTVIPFEPLWAEYKRIIKKNGAIVLFGAEPFSSHLRMSNIEWFKYDWYWAKNDAGDAMNAKNKPMRKIETISVFSPGTTANRSERRMEYYPQDLTPTVVKRSGTNYGATGGSFKTPRPSHKPYVQEFTNYPVDLLSFSKDVKDRFHPTQKPVALCEYLIKTYTNEGEWVLDNCMGSGTTGVACINTKRNFIGIEKDDKYFEIAKKRIEEHLTTAST